MHEHELIQHEKAMLNVAVIEYDSFMHWHDEKRNRYLKIIFTRFFQPYFVCSCTYTLRIDSCYYVIQCIFREDGNMHCLICRYRHFIFIKAVTSVAYIFHNSVEHYMHWYADMSCKYVTVDIRKKDILILLIHALIYLC